MAYRLLAADYDLTLTGRDHKVNDHTRETIRRVFEAGNFVTLATGRVSDGAEQARELFPGDVPLILCNGGVLQRSGDGSLLSERVMPAADARTVMDWCLRWEGAAMVWTRDGLFADRFNEGTEVYKRLTSKGALPLAPEEAARTGVYKFLFLSYPDVIRRAQAELTADRPADVDFFTSSPEALEIVPKGVNKGAGLLRCAQLLGIAPAETMAVGDGENDIAMLRAAALGAAMGNAPDNVKAAADLVVPSCEEDGAAWLMEQYLL